MNLKEMFLKNKIRNSIIGIIVLGLICGFFINSVFAKETGGSLNLKSVTGTVEVVEKMEKLKKAEDSSKPTLTVEDSENPQSNPEVTSEVSQDSSDKTNTSQPMTSEKQTASSKKASTSSSATKSTPAVVDKTAPVITGVSNKNLAYGSSFNVMEGVTSHDNFDGNVTSKIQVSGTVNTSCAGAYSLKYSVTDNSGNTAYESCVITINPKVEQIEHMSSMESQLFAMINEYRVQNGLNEIAYSNVQYSKANNLAKEKATANRLDGSHYANEISIVIGGSHPSATSLLNMWKSSSSHNSFLLSNTKNYGGCAIYRNGSNYYVILEARYGNN